MKAINLKTNDRIAPLGIDTLSPKFRWNCQGGTKQTAYRITVKDEVGTLLWDSGRVESPQMSCAYGGTPLTGTVRCYWKVTLWDEMGAMEESDISWFEMGLLEPWQAKWICGVDTDRAERLPADYFRKTFSLAKPVRSARLYATACGVYAAFVNGKRLPGVLAPGTTEYEKRLHYQTYDITDLLLEDNTLEVVLGDGWFKGKLGSTNNQYFFGNQLKLLCQMVITYTDGSREILGTDGSWRWCNDGPILYADLKDGEVYDARKTPSFGAFAQITDYPVAPIASPSDIIEEHEIFHPIALTSPSGKSILDFGQNLAGYIRFRIQGRPGQVITLRMAEALDHGEYSDATLLHVRPGLPSTKQEIVYTCKGGNEIFQPEFFYSGFRYALVEGVDKTDPEDFEAVAVYTGLDFTGSFHCSNSAINKFMENTLWSMKSNFVDVPTDCPQREKSGWMGDAQVFVRTASYFADTAAFYRKWLRDVRDCQREDGRPDSVCPRIRPRDNLDALNGSSGWADAAVIIPYTLWKLYGDDSVIRENYDLMHGWKEYCIQAAADKSYYHLPDGHMLKAMVEPFLLPESPWQKYIIESGLHWGEWLEPNVDSGKEIVCPKQELTAAYLHYSMGLLAEMLFAIDKGDEAAQCQEYADGAKAAYNHYFVKNGHINAPRQAPMVRALALGLLDEETQKQVAADLNADAIARDYTVGTGFLSTPFVLGVLARHGYVDTAYKMLENTVAPGWLAMVTSGATTVWEAYKLYDDEGHPLKLSMNHYSPGAVCAFLFDTVCGIRVDGRNHAIIHPVPGGTLEFAQASYRSPYGVIESFWQRTGEKTHYTITIPANMTAEIILPGIRGSVTAGTWNYEVNQH